MDQSCVPRFFERPLYCDLLELARKGRRGRAGTPKKLEMQGQKEM
jgi:hypothetical protein